MPFAGDRKHRRNLRSTPLLPHFNNTPISQSESGFSGASFSGAVFNLSTTIVGAGIMALPATLKQLGMIPGLIIIILVGVLTETSVDMILRFSKASKSNSYSGLVGDAFGGAGKMLLQFGIVVNNVGLLVVYLIIIGIYIIIALIYCYLLCHNHLIKPIYAVSYFYPLRLFGIAYLSVYPHMAFC